MTRPHFAVLPRSISVDERLADLPDDACRLFYLMLQPASDDYGRATARPRALGAMVWPMLNKSPEETERCIRALVETGLVTLYSGQDEDPFIEISDWDESGGSIGKKDHRYKSRFPDASEAHLAPLGPDWPGLVRSGPRARPRAPEGQDRTGQEKDQDRTGQEQPRKPRKLPTGDHAETIQHWVSEWGRTRLGTKCAISTADGVAVAWMLKQEDAQEVRRRMTLMLEDQDAWIAKNASPALLRSKWNAYAVTVSAPTRNGKADVAALWRSQKGGDQ